nr:hypothetical protein Iba_chr13fCG2690 [Ipomoea batatas]
MSYGSTPSLPEAPTCIGASAGPLIARCLFVVGVEVLCIGSAFALGSLGLSPRRGADARYGPVAPHLESCYIVPHLATIPYKADHIIAFSWQRTFRELMALVFVTRRQEGASDWSATVYELYRLAGLIRELILRAGMSDGICRCMGYRCHLQRPSKDEHLPEMISDLPSSADTLFCSYSATSTDCFDGTRGIAHLRYHGFHNTSTSDTHNIGYLGPANGSVEVRAETVGPLVIDRTVSILLRLSSDGVLQSLVT